MKAKTVIPAFRPTDILLAGVLLTRLPLPRLSEAQFARSAAATWAYPLVGAALGIFGACVWVLAGWMGLTSPVQAGLTLVALVFMTGALHEDGLADTADGLWGGMTPERRLEIMKDSRIGAYGVIALILAFGLRWQALIVAGPISLIAAATLSRAVLPAMMTFVPFARKDGLAQSVGAPPLINAAIAVFLGAGIAWISLGLFAALIALILAMGVAVILQALAQRKIGGITGDILGATQLVAEIAILICLMG